MKLWPVLFPKSSNGNSNTGNKSDMPNANPVAQALPPGAGPQKGPPLAKLSGHLGGPQVVLLPALACPRPTNAC